MMRGVMLAAFAHAAALGSASVRAQPLYCSRWLDITTCQISAMIESARRLPVILPVGLIEAHGPHPGAPKRPDRFLNNRTILWMRWATRR